VLIGLSSGFAVAGGVFAFITMLGIVPRLADRTGTVRYIVWYERMIVWGGTVGNVWFLFQLPAHGTWLLLAAFGLCAGIYVGCLAMALAEMLRLLPIFVNRLQIKEGFPLLVLAIALGKVTGTLFQFIFS
jgi:stage V sporulation protein AB